MVRENYAGRGASEMQVRCSAPCRSYEIISAREARRKKNFMQNRPALGRFHPPLAAAGGGRREVEGGEEEGKEEEKRERGGEGERKESKLVTSSTLLNAPYFCVTALLWRPES